MLGITMSLQGDLDLGKIEVEVECPRCSFYVPIWVKQAKLGDIVICRGCKANIRLDDHMNSVRKAVRSVQRAMDDLRKTLSTFGR